MSELAMRGAVMRARRQADPKGRQSEPANPATMLHVLLEDLSNDDRWLFIQILECMDKIAADKPRSAPAAGREDDGAEPVEMSPAEQSIYAAYRGARIQPGEAPDAAPDRSSVTLEELPEEMRQGWLKIIDKLNELLAEDAAF